MSSLRSDTAKETGTAGPDIRIDTEVLTALSVGDDGSETEPKICRWLECWRR
jgi:hypothetical protein